MGIKGEINHVKDGWSLEGEGQSTTISARSVERNEWKGKGIHTE